MLHRLSAGDPDRQLRAAVLWTANPLLLQVLVAGAARGQPGHLLRRGRGRRPSFRPADRPDQARQRRAAGRTGRPRPGRWPGWASRSRSRPALPGARPRPGRARSPAGSARSRPGGPDALVWPLAALGAGSRSWRGRPWRSGGSAHAGPDRPGQQMVSIGSPWRVIRTRAAPVMHDSAGRRRGQVPARSCWPSCSRCWSPGRCGRGVGPDRVLADRALAEAALADRELAGRPRTWRSLDGVDGNGGPADPSRPFLPTVLCSSLAAPWRRCALSLAWLLAWPYVLPWYDGLAWALLPLVAASSLNGCCSPAPRPWASATSPRGRPGWSCRPGWGGCSR